METDYCPYYHINCTDKVDMHQCWAIAERTHITKDIIHCGCEGDKERCDFKKVGINDERLQGAD